LTFSISFSSPEARRRIACGLFLNPLTKPARRGMMRKKSLTYGGFAPKRASFPNLDAKVNGDRILPASPADKFMKKVIGKAKLKPGWEEMK